MLYYIIGFGSRSVLYCTKNYHGTESYYTAHCRMYCTVLCCAVMVLYCCVPCCTAVQRASMLQLREVMNSTATTVAATIEQQ
jgi:hypothetical protein